MKFFTFIAFLLLTSMVSFTQTTPNCPTSFARNNGNGGGALGHLKLYYTQMPAIAPTIDSVIINSAKYPVTFGAAVANTGYLEYPVTSGNMPPANSWFIWFHTTTATDKFGCNVPSNTGPLPIIINSFMATRSNSIITLNWQTSYEQNAQWFEIERKTNNGFVTVAKVTATNHLMGSTYSFTEENNYKGSSEYRLKLVCGDADAKYSDTKSVKGMGATIDFTIFPNPARSNTKIAVMDIHDQTIAQVIDNTGKVIRTLTFKANNTLEINDLQTGIYRIQLKNTRTGETVTKTLTIIQ